MFWHRPVIISQKTQQQPFSTCAWMHPLEVYYPACKRRPWPTWSRWTQTAMISTGGWPVLPSGWNPLAASLRRHRLRYKLRKSSLPDTYSCWRVLSLSFIYCVMSSSREKRIGLSYWSWLTEPQTASHFTSTYPSSRNVFTSAPTCTILIHFLPF